MSPETHFEIANFIWSICNLLRGPYKRNDPEFQNASFPILAKAIFETIPGKAE